MRNSENILLHSLNQVPACIFWKDAEGHYQGVNEEFCRFIGVKREEIIGRKDAQIPLHEGIKGRFREGDQVVITSGQPTWGMKESVVLQNGKNVHVVMNKSPLKDEEGNLKGVISLFVAE